MTGTLTVDGKTRQVHGTGYHDHQWGNRFYLPEWNNWLWARQSFEDYSILTFDFIASETYGFQRFPIVFVQDKNGDLVFESKEKVSCAVDRYYTDETASGKAYPDTIRYACEIPGKRLEYTIRRKEILEAQGFRNGLWIVKLIAKKLGMLDLSYSRFYGEGQMRLTLGEETAERSGNLIYEFMFPGKSCKGLMEIGENENV